MKYLNKDDDDDDDDNGVYDNNSEGDYIQINNSMTSAPEKYFILEKVGDLNDHSTNENNIHSSQIEDFQESRFSKSKIIIFILMYIKNTIFRM